MCVLGVVLLSNNNHLTLSPLYARRHMLHIYDYYVQYTHGMHVCVCYAGVCVEGGDLGMVCGGLFLFVSKNACISI